MIYVWIAAFALFMIVEAATVSLVTIWFAIGSLAGLVLAAFGAQVWVQILSMLVVSLAVLVLARPIIRKRVNIRKTPTNADRVIGMVCPVTEDIDNVLETGAVTVDGKVWTARSADGQRLLRGTLVRPVAIEGVKLIVEVSDDQSEILSNS